MHSSIEDIAESYISDRMFSGGMQFHEYPEKIRKELIKDTIRSSPGITLRFLFDGNDISNVSKHISKVKQMNFWDVYDNDVVFSIPDSSFTTVLESYHFNIEPTITVDVLHRKDLAHEYFINIAKNEGFKALAVHDFEFIERYAADKLILADWSNNRIKVWPIYNRLARNYHRLARNDYKMKKMLHNNNHESTIHSDEEIEIIDEVEDDRVDNKKFSGFTDKEKIHIKLLEYCPKKDANKISYIPIFIGIGNNYPFTRKTNIRIGYGDDRYYRESFNISDNSLTIQQFIKGMKSYKRNSAVLKNTRLNNIIIKKFHDPDQAKIDLLDIINKSQTYYPEYFDNVFSIDDLYRAYIESTGEKYDPSKIFRDKRLMLNPAIRIRAAALTAYNKMDEVWKS